MAEALTAEQKLAAVKLKLTGELLGFYKSFINGFNSKSLEMLKLVQSRRKDEGETIVIKMTKDEFNELYEFFRRGQEKDLVTTDSGSYYVEKCQEMQIKEKILADL